MDHLTLLEHQSPKNPRLTLFPVPCDIGSHSPIMADGPAYLLQKGLVSALTAAGFEVQTEPEISALRRDLGDVSVDQAVQAVAAQATQVRGRVCAERRAGRKILTIGGDHSIAIGSVAGAAQAASQNIGLIWIDAHADINTPATSPSGNVHGMPVAVLLGQGDARLTTVVTRPIKKEHLLYIGIKDLDQPEIDFLRRENIAAVTLFTMLEQGFSAVTQAIDRLLTQVDEVWVSLDLDAIDESVAPASAMATSGSMSYREITSLCTYLGKTGKVVGMDIAELTPAKDVEGKTAELCFELSAATLGGRYGWYERYVLEHGKKE